MVNEPEKLKPPENWIEYLKKFAPQRLGHQVVPGDFGDARRHSVMDRTWCCDRDDPGSSPGVSGAVPMIHDSTHKSKRNMSLDQLEELRAVEYRATANLVWLADIGASYDVVPKGLAEVYGWKKVPLPEPIRMGTANGPVETQGAVLTWILGMSEEVHALEFGGTPPLLSVGRRCLSEGYSFVWIAGRNPYFVTKEGMILPCKTSCGVLYIDTEDPDCKLRPVTVFGNGSYVRMMEQSRGSQKKLIIVGTIGIPHGQQPTRALTAGTFLVVEKPVSDEHFEDISFPSVISTGDVSGDLLAVSGAFPMAVDEEHP